MIAHHLSLNRQLPLSAHLCQQHISFHVWIGQLEIVLTKNLDLNKDNMRLNKSTCLKYFSQIFVTQSTGFYSVPWLDGIVGFRFTIPSPPLRLLHTVTVYPFLGRSTDIFHQLLHFHPLLHRAVERSKAYKSNIFNTIWGKSAVNRSGRRRIEGREKP